MADTPLTGTTGNFTYHECPDCEFNAVTEANGKTYCCLCCWADGGHDVVMRSRPARADDVVEGRDARKEQANAG